MRRFWTFTASVVLFSATFQVTAEDYQTDWIEPVVGFKDKMMGAEVQSVELTPANDGSTVMIKIPKDKMAPPDQIQEIIVLSMKPPEKEQKKIQISHEWATDFAGDYYGLILHVGESGNLPIRVYFKGLDVSQ